MSDGILDLFARYVLLISKLWKFADQTYHVQRRTTFIKLFNATSRRLLELKSYLAEMELCQYTYVDDTLIKLKLTVRDFDIVSPAQLFERPELIQELVNKMEADEVLFEYPVPESEEPVVTELIPRATQDVVPQIIMEDDDEDEESVVHLVDSDEGLTLEEREEKRKYRAFQALITFFQKHERARQGRALFHHTVRLNEIKRTEKKKLTADEIAQMHKDATTVQRLWKKHVMQKREQERERLFRISIGMNPGTALTKNKEKQKECLLQRRMVRKQNFEEMVEKKEKIKTRVLVYRAPCIMEDISDEIRDWFHEWYEKANTFDKFPFEDEGGTMIVVSGQTQSLEEYIEEERKRKELEALYAEKPELKRKAEAEKKKQKLLDKANKKKEKLLKKMQQNLPPPPFTLLPTDAFMDMQRGIDEYKALWTIRNDDNRYYEDTVVEDAYEEIHLELRKIVDEVMREEYKLLLMARAVDKGIKYVPPKPKKKRRKRGAGKDMTKKRMIEDLFQEMLDNGIIKKYPKTNLEDYEGDYNYGAFDLRSDDKDPWPCLGDVKSVILSRCILPLQTLGSEKNKGICIIGPRQSGKKMLINAICTETQAVLFDISPPVLVGKYPGKKGNKMLMHLLTKMPRLLQPSVIFIDGGEKPFYSRVPPTERANDPKRMKKLQKEIISKITPIDQVLVIATSKEPWLASARDFKKCWPILIMVPSTDYASLLMYWRKILLEYHGVDREFDFSSLARATLGYPLNYIKETTEKVMTAHRIIRLKYEPLSPQELRLALLVNGVEPVIDEEEVKFKDWYYGTTEYGVKKIAYVVKMAEIKLKDALMKAAEKAQNKRK